MFVTARTERPAMLGVRRMVQGAQHHIVGARAGLGEQLLDLTGIEPETPATVAEIHFDFPEPENQQRHIALWADRYHGRHHAAVAGSGQANKDWPSATGWSTGAGMLTVDEIDWPTWQPTECACLCFIIRAGRILLIRKKRGLGAGKINGPGGRLESGETALQSAIRETQEEVGVTPVGLEQIGELRFQFLDGYKLHVAVFTARDCIGELCETDEATPIWTDLSQIPYGEMWQDDPHWLPLVLKREIFSGVFVFEVETLLSYRIVTA